MLRSPCSRALPALVAVLFAVPAVAQIDGYVLYNNSNQSTARLLNTQGVFAHTWSCPTPYSYSMALKPDGHIVRTAVHTGNSFFTPAISGKVQELDPQGQVVWEFIYSTANYVTHHDMCLMPNGNVLLLAYVKRTLAELQAMGYTGNTARYPGRIIEIEPTGNTAQVVWQWDIEDRFIQYVDPNKPNYLPIADHPERLNINVAASGSGIDWFHENGIDYNPELDQIAFSARHLNEIFIIDHSTTTAEAAGHSGGNGGRGGDFLFRWGKPANYGVAGTQRIPNAVHDVRWIKPGRPGAGQLMFVNNNIGGNTTAIDVIDPERVGANYPWTPGTVWGPDMHAWRHTCLTYASGQSAADRLPDGNTFVALSGGFMYEINSSGQLVWQYAASPQKAFRYTCDDPGIIALLGEDPCGLTTEVGERAQGPPVTVFPNPTTGIVSFAGLAMQDVETVVVSDALGREAVRSGPVGTLDLGGLPDGVYHLIMHLRNGTREHHRVLLQH